MRALALLLFPLLAACGQEPDFDERYDAAVQQIDEKAAELDAELKHPSAEEEAEDSAE